MKKVMKNIGKGFSWLCFLGLIGVLPSCSQPIYKTTYQYQKPFSSSAISCIDACDRDLSYCDLRVQQEDKLCTYYGNSAGEPINTKQSVAMPSHSLQGSETCKKQQRSCQMTYDQCFVGCGGQVVLKKQCIDHCSSH